MNVWRWLGISFFVITVAAFIGATNFSALVRANEPKTPKDVVISAKPEKADVKPGDSTDVEIKIVRGKEAAKEVTLEVESKEKTVTAKVDAKLAADKKDTKMTVKTESGTPEGNYTITVKAKSDGSTDSTATFTLTVKKAETTTTPAGDIDFKAFNPDAKKFFTMSETTTTQDMTVNNQKVKQT